MCDKKLKNNSENIEALARKALILMEKKEFIEAKRYFFRVSELDTQFYPDIVYDNLGEIYFKEEKDYNKARKYFNMALEISPKPEI